MKRLMPVMVMALVCLVAGGAQEDSIKSALSTSGIPNPSVTVSGSEVTVAYNQSVAAFGTVDSELGKVAVIMKAVSDNMHSATLVTVEQHFDDGQIMAIVGKPADGAAFVAGQINREAFLGRIDFNPLTRGPPIMEGVCEPGKGESCQTAPECMCYPNEVCQPGGQGANAKGCVVQQAPANAHLVGTEYACNKGYAWNVELTGCVQSKVCPQNAFEFLGQCECLAGYAWDSGRVNCVATGGAGVSGGAGSTGSTGGTVPGSGQTQNRGGGDQLQDLIKQVTGSPFFLPGIAVVVLLIILGIALKLRGRKKPPMQPQQQAGNVIIIRQ